MIHDTLVLGIKEGNLVNGYVSSIMKDRFQKIED